MRAQILSAALSSCKACLHEIGACLCCNVHGSVLPCLVAAARRADFSTLPIHVKRMNRIASG